MKHWIFCTVLFLSNSIAFACGPWYPYGEEVRYSMFDPGSFDQLGLSPFYYTSERWGYHFEEGDMADPNVVSWMHYVDKLKKKGAKGTVTREAIVDVLYKTKDNALLQVNNHPFLVFLMENGRKDVVDYLRFAKSTEPYCMVYYALWEKPDEDLGPKRLEKIKRGQKYLKKADSDFLKRRYAYLTMRLAHYAGQSELVDQLFADHFKNNQHDNLYYRSLFFSLADEPSSVEKNVAMAQIFLHAPSKRMVAYRSYSKKIRLEDCLGRAVSKEDKAALYAINSVRKAEKDFYTLEKIYEQDPGSPLFDFLLIRELNKLEDWVLTTKYNSFPPAINSHPWDEGAIIKRRVREDKIYASQLAEWLTTLDHESLNSPMLARLISSYLYSLSGKPDLAISTLQSKISGQANPDHQKTLTQLSKQLELLYRIQNTSILQLPLPKADQDLIMSNDLIKQGKYLFTLAREFEFKGNTTMAAALFSQLDGYNWDNREVWRSKRGQTTLYSDFYYDYFFYMDDQYSPKQVQELINFSQKKTRNTFHDWLVKKLREDEGKLYDLLGTKHIRRNELKPAILAFKKVPNEWMNREEYKHYLGANPFYADFYTEHRKTKGDTVRYTKLEIAQKLQKMLDKAENPSLNPEKRSHLYFQVANCYFNMTHYGNSWMMRRFWWSRNDPKTSLPDEAEYHECSLAKKYYEKAEELATNEKIQSLCVRMQGRCEQYRLKYRVDYWEFRKKFENVSGKRPDYNDYIFQQNPHFRDLKERFPEDYHPLISNCESFSQYYAYY